VQNNRYRHGITGASFLMGYGLLRFMTEFAREPDVQLGFVLGSFSMGQVLCFIMIVSGAFVMNHVYKSQKIMGAK
jgi:phosphatidylglycerol:prolipoprotein diacylglycerol transferase